MKTLKQYRKENGITQVEMARALSVNQSSVCRLEGDAPKIGIHLALKIAEVTKGAVPVESWGRK